MGLSCSIIVIIVGIIVVIVIVIVIVIVVVVIIVVSIILVRTLDPFKGYNRFYLVCMWKYIHARRLKEKKGKEIISGESKER